MNTFTEKVRKSKIPYPTQRGFTLEKWKKGFSDHSSSSELDQNLYNSGVWIYKQLNGIRIKQKSIQWGDCNSKELIRYFCGFINRACHIIMQKKDSVVGEDFFISELVIQTKTPENIFQPNAHPDELLTGLIDGSRHAIIYALKYDSVSAKDALPDNDILDRTMKTMLLGQLYDQGESLWMDCLWLNKYVIEKNEADFIINSDNDAGKKLDGLGGIGAILKYKLNY